MNSIKININKFLKQFNKEYNFLYDNNVLHDTFLYMEKNNFDIIFGKAVYYNIEKNGNGS